MKGEAMEAEKQSFKENLPLEIERVSALVKAYREQDNSDNLWPDVIERKLARAREALASGKDTDVFNAYYELVGIA